VTGVATVEGGGSSKTRPVHWTVNHPLARASAPVEADVGMSTSCERSKSLTDRCRVRPFAPAAPLVNQTRPPILQVVNLDGYVVSYPKVPVNPKIRFGLPNSRKVASIAATVVASAQRGWKSLVETLRVRKVEAPERQLTVEQVRVRDRLTWQVPSAAANGTESVAEAVCHAAMGLTQREGVSHVPAVEAILTAYVDAEEARRRAYWRIWRMRMSRTVGWVALPVAASLVTAWCARRWLAERTSMLWAWIIALAVAPVPALTQY
jgi:hypothetical protein